MLRSRSKVLILGHQDQVDVIVGEAHLEETVKTIAQIGVCDGVLLDAGDVYLLGSDEVVAYLLLWYQTNVWILNFGVGCDRLTR